MLFCRIGRVGRFGRPSVIATVGASALLLTVLVDRGSAFASPSASKLTSGCASQPVGVAPTVPAITASPRTDDWRLQYARAERVMFGLDASDAAIQRAEDDPMATSADLATPLTPPEVATLDQEDRANQLIAALQTFVSANDLSDINTIFVDPAERATIDVGVANHDCGVVSQLIPLSGGITIRAIDSPTSVNSFVSQERLAALNSVLPSLQDQGVHVDLAQVDEQTGVLNIQLDPTSSANAAELVTSTIGASGVSVTLDGHPQVSADARMDPPPVVRAGEDITGGSNDCTSNISATNDNGYYVITAGHCFLSDTQQVSQNNGPNFGMYAGPTTSKYLGTPLEPGGQIIHAGAVVKCDCEAIGTIAYSRTSSSEYGNNNNIYDFYHVANQNSDFTGSPSACESGVREYEVFYGQDICGQITDASTTITTGAWGFNYTVEDTIEVTYPTSPTLLAQKEGDSGAPVSHNRTILGAVITTGNVAYESKLKNITDIYPRFHYLIPYD